MFVILCSIRVVIDFTMASSLRSAPENWLLGKPQSQLSTTRLPRWVNGFYIVYFHHAQQKNTLPESYNVTCENGNAIWSCARNPTHRIDSCVRKLPKLYERYLRQK